MLTLRSLIRPTRCLKLSSSRALWTLSTRTPTPKTLGPCSPRQVAFHSCFTPAATSQTEKKEKQAWQVTIDQAFELASNAQQAFLDPRFTQAAVDNIFRAVAQVASTHRIELAQLAVADTGMGIVEDKVIKNHFASEFVYNKYKDTRTVGIIETDARAGFEKFAEPVGPILGLIPVTNPTSTVIYKSLLALKTKNAIVFCPHPKAAKCTAAAAKLLNEAVVAAGGPNGLVQCIEFPSTAVIDYLLHHPLNHFILATGGGAMVRASYASGKPCIGVGAGNTPALIDETADLAMAVSSILLSKTFDNGVICASEQTVVAVDQVYESTVEEFKLRGAAVIRDAAQRDALRAAIFPEGHLNPKVVGQPATAIAALAGIQVPSSTQMILVEINKVDGEPLALEKLSPVLAILRTSDFKTATQSCLELVQHGGMGHTACVYTDEANMDRIRYFEQQLPTGRILVDSPASFGAIGDVYNSRLEPSLCLGSGTWGGSSFSGNVGVQQLLNIKNLAIRRENMLWIKLPPSVYFKSNIVEEALKDVSNCQRCLIITDSVMVQLQQERPLVEILQRMQMKVDVFHDISPDPDVACVRKGVDRMKEFQPDLVIALGGGSPMDAAKVMRLMYEHPEVRFEDLVARFMDIRKRVIHFPNLGSKVKKLVCIPSTSGTGAEVTPFAVIKDDKTHRKYPLADYSLTPDIAIVDANFAQTMPAKLAAATGMDALTHAIESYVSIVATEFTQPLSLKAMQLLVKNLPDAVRGNATSREHVHHGSLMAGIAFANAFLGINHSLAHALGSEFGVPHGVANALLLPHIIAFNATEKPIKRGVFAQYKFYHATQDYAAMAKAVGLPGDTAKALTLALIRRIEELRREVGIASSLSNWGISETELSQKVSKMALLAFDDQCTGASPRYPLVKEIVQIYWDAFKGPPNVLHLEK